MAEDDTLEVSYERSEIVRHSMIPLIDDAVEEFHKLFTDARKKTTLTNNTLKKHSKGDDYKVDAILHMDMNNFEDHDIETLKEMLQSYCDQANIAKRESALNAERNLNLQSRLSSTEIANVRLTKVVEDLEVKIFELLQKLNKEETTRISLVREFKEINDKLGNDKKGLRKELSSTKKDVQDLQAQNAKLDSQKKKAEVEITHLQDRARHAEAEVASLQTRLTEALQRENQSNTSLTKAQNLVDDLKAELENERIKSQGRIEKVERDGRKNYAEKEHALQKQISSLKNEINEIHDGYNRTFKDHQNVATAAIERLTKDVEELDASRIKYYNQYKALLEDLNDHKRKISHDVLKQAILKLTNEYRNDQIKTTQVKKTLQTIDLQNITNFGERCLDVLVTPPSHSSSSTVEENNFRSHRNENQPPQPERRPPTIQPGQSGRYRSSSVRDTAQRYDVRGNYRSNTRR